MEGNQQITGDDYVTWGLATDVNQWAYEWCASKLNLVLFIETPSEKVRIEEGPIVNDGDVESF